ncbi:MAG: hypothetical protein Q7S74_01710 [Nanoarchaeota archaeon]|nr:hypothetical protein [Nanoarchaeota archaeon]
MRSNTNYKIGVLSILIGFLFLSFITGSLAIKTEFKASNDSIQAKELLNQAEKDIFEMIERNISVKRVNESYQEALQLYSAQITLEEKSSKADYKLIIKDASDVSSIKQTAIEANDELKIFKETFANAKKEVNLSEMQNEYDQVVLSFQEERFEDTLILIKKGYDKISEIQSSQTAVNAVYLATSRTVKNFFIQNGLRILIIGGIFFFLLLVFWNTLTKLKMRIKLNNLIIQKNAIKRLIKEIQESYFKSRKISESEYNIKLKKYEELIRDLERQIMVLKEEVFKMSKNKGN